MPQVDQGRRHITLRLDERGVARVDALAVAAGVDRSEMLRMLLRLGLREYARGAR